MSQTAQNLRRRRRRILWLRLVLAGLAACTLAAVLLPWWLPAVVTRLAASRGATVGAWTSHGWSGTEYQNITYSTDTVRVSVGSLRVPVLGTVPVGAAEAGPAIRASDVSVVVDAKPREDARPAAASEMVRAIDRVWAGMKKWLPPAHVERASIEASGKRFELATLDWDGVQVRTNVSLPWDGWLSAVTFSEIRPERWLVTADTPLQQLSSELEIGTASEAGAEVAGLVRWRGNTARVHAVFGGAGLLPENASITADPLSVPAAELGLDGYGPVNGSLRLEWLRDAYVLAVQAHADPEAGTEWPAAAIEVRATGDLRAVRVEAVDVKLPGVKAGLSAPVSWTFAEGLPSGPAEFDAELELGAVPRISAQGRMAGTIRVRSSEGDAPQVDFAILGSGLAWRGVEGARLDLAGVWRSREVLLESAVLELGSGEKSELSGRIDLASGTVHDGRVQAAVPNVLLHALSPTAPPCERIGLDLFVDGPLASPKHRGHVNLVGLEWSRDRKIGADVSWSGEGRSATGEGTLGLAGGGTLPFAGQAEVDADGHVRATLERVRWIDDQGEWWRLEAPVHAEYATDSGELSVAPWTISGIGLSVTGEARVRWPVAGQVKLDVTGLRGERFGGVLPEAIRNGSIESLHLNAGWDNGPLALAGDIRAIYTPVAKTSFAVEGQFATRDGGLAFGSLQILGESGAVLRGTGRLPLTVSGTKAGFQAAFAPEGQISLELSSEPNPVFWKSIADLTGWAVDEPRLACRFDGSIAAPHGEVDFSAETLRPPAIKLANGGRLPDLTGLAIKLAADDHGLAITESMVAIDNRWITLRGRAPWEVWTHWRQTDAIDWRQATFELASNPLPIVIASRVFPTQLAPVGEVSIKIAHEPGPGMSGRIWLHGAALRPLGKIGAVRDIQCELDFEKYRMMLTSLEGTLSGQAVKISGQADMEDVKHPLYELHVKSSRVPLVRRSGLIVRAEMDLTLKQERSGPARIYGRLDFGPSLFSADLLSLIPSGVESPESRPPYFSVDEEPFSQWELDVAVHGDAFLRITTPFFKDLLSTDLTLSGTLGDPRVVGWVWGSGGAVTFPFGSIGAEQVLVTLTKENPFEPTLVVSGSGRVLGYDVRMEASGPVSDPRLLFTSDPPLTSQQVFLMLTSGAVPGESNSIATSDRARRVAFFLGRNLATGLGLSTGDGGSDRLVIRSGEDFTRNGGETVYVQYDLNGRWSIVGEYDRFDAYNGGLKFRLLSR